MKAAIAFVINIVGQACGIDKLETVAPVPLKSLLGYWHFFLTTGGIIANGVC